MLITMLNPICTQYILDEEDIIRKMYSFENGELDYIILVEEKSDSYKIDYIREDKIAHRDPRYFEENDPSFFDSAIDLEEVVSEKLG